MAIYNPGKKRLNANEKAMVDKITKAIESGDIDVEGEITSFEELSNISNSLDNQSVDTDADNTSEDFDFDEQADFDISSENPLAEQIKPERTAEIAAKADAIAKVYAPSENKESAMENNMEEQSVNEGMSDHSNSIDTDVDVAPIPKNPWELNSINNVAPAEKPEDTEASPEDLANEKNKAKLTKTATKMATYKAAQLFCNGVVGAGKWYAKIDEWKVKKLEMQKKLSMDTVIDTEGTTLSDYVKTHNESVDLVIEIDDESKEELANCLFMVAEEHGIEVSPMMNLGMTAGSILIGVFSQAQSLRKQGNRQIEMAVHLFKEQARANDLLQQQMEESLEQRVQEEIERRMKAQQPALDTENTRAINVQQATSKLSQDNEFVEKYDKEEMSKRIEDEEISSEKKVKDERTK